MDERRKTVRELEERQREDLLALNAMLEKLGGSVLPRLEGGDAADSGRIGIPAPEDRAEYRELIKEIENSQEDIRTVEGDVARFKELEDAVQHKEGEYTERNKELAEYYARMGERVLEEKAYESFAEPFRQQLEVLVPKIKSLEDRLDVLEERGDANVFTWIGKSAQGMVLRGFLGKSQGNLRRIYQAAGEKFAASSPSEPIQDENVLRMRGDIEKQRNAQAVLSGELARLKEERRKLGDSLEGEGNPGRRIQSLERHIHHAEEKLRDLYRRYGRQLEDLSAVEDLGSLLAEEDLPLLDQISALRAAMAEYARRIEKLKAALDIEETQVEISKLEKAIAGQRARIAACEMAIDQYEKKIIRANDRIEELGKLIQ
ncbi:MAG: hypothetical protein LBG76_08200 [Treponema sp.]|jgi:chromosome segregation ATPase|nr:hypothetical protein [Treponema sp.]